MLLGILLGDWHQHRGKTRDATVMTSRGFTNPEFPGDSPCRHITGNSCSRMFKVSAPPQKKKERKKSVAGFQHTANWEKHNKSLWIEALATIKIIFPQFLLVHLYRVLGVNIFSKQTRLGKAPHFGDATSTNFPPFPQIFRKSQTWSDSFNGLMNKTRPLPSSLTSCMVGYWKFSGGGYNIPYHSPQ